MHPTFIRPQEQHYFPHIDGLRAVAVVSVVLFHLFPHAIPSGYIGVDIFFVISGYVITKSLFAHADAPLIPFLAGFYARRLRRLLPALVVCITVSAVVLALFDPSPRESQKTAIAALLGVANLYLYAEQANYFGTAAQLNGFTHTWSLGVEEQFYVIFPVLLWLVVFRDRQSGSTRHFLILAGIASAASLIGFFVLSVHKPFAAYFLTPVRFWELSAGAMLFLCGQQKHCLHVRGACLNPSWGLLTLCLLMFVPEKYFAVAVTLAVAATALLIATLRPDAFATRALSHPKVVHLGRISYSLYLWHWPVIVASRWTIGLHWWLVPLQLLVIWGLAELSYRYIETPFRRSAASRYRTIATGLAAVAIAITVLSVLKLDQIYVGQRPQMAANGTATLAAAYRMPQLPSSVWPGEPCVLMSNGEVAKKIYSETCTLGNPATAERRVLAIGNSSAAAFVPAFGDVVPRDGYAVTIADAWGASPVGGVPNESEWSEANKYYWQHVIPRLIATLKPGDWVFLVSDVSGFSPRVQTAESMHKLQRFEAGLIGLAADLRSKQIRLAVLHGLPFMHEAVCTPAMAAPQWFAPFGRPCNLYSKRDTLTRRSALHEMLGRLQAQGHLTVVDLMPVFCPGEQCEYFSPTGIPLYRDEWCHASIEAARLSGPIIREHLGGE